MTAIEILHASRGYFTLVRSLVILGGLFFFLCGPVEAQKSLSEIEAIQQRVHKAENTADTGLLEDLFTDDAIYLNPEGPPIVGDLAIHSLFEVMFSRYTWTSSYQNDASEVRGDSAWVTGTYSYKLVPVNNGDTQEESVPFEWSFVKESERWKLDRLIYGEIVEPQSRVPDLPKPTGQNGIGIRDFSFMDPDRIEIFTPDPSDKREVSFQIWYPAQTATGQEPRPYRNREMTRAAARFLGWPLFANSYNVFVASNSFSKAPAKVSRQPYPVIMYNHGYSGFTSVHQTVIEDLASHGFVVVSVGHANESALFLRSDGSVEGFDPENEAYRARQVESSGREQERLKSQIMAASNSSDRENSYRQLLEESPLHQQSVEIWAADNRFVLKQLELIHASDPNLKGMFDLENVGIVGHSLGGATSGEMAITESTIKAGINLDGFQFGGLLEAVLRVPFMFVWENGPNSESTTNANDLFCQKSEATCYTLVIQGFEHATFTDMPLFSSIWESTELDPSGLRAIQLQREYILGFFNKHLKNMTVEVLNGPSQKFPEVVLRRF